LVSDIKGATETEGAQEDIWSKEGCGDRRVEKKLHNKKLRDLYSLPSIIRIIT
jgi:hypothetical protein